VGHQAMNIERLQPFSLANADRAIASVQILLVAPETASVWHIYSSNEYKVWVRKN